MIRSIDIQRFRCFKHLKIEGCRRINVIVGDNGSGKTALLEAIFFALGVTTELAARYRQQRGLAAAFSGSSRKLEETIWRDYFYNRDWSRPVSVALKGDGPEARRVSIGFTSSSVQTSTSDPADSIETAPIKVTWTDAKGRARSVVPSVSSATGRANFPSTDEDLPDFFYFSAQQTLAATEIAERFADVRRHGRQTALIHAITEEFDLISDLELDVIASAPIVSAVMEDNARRPLGNVSGGLNRMVGIMLTTASRTRSVVLIDEAENGIYFRHHAAVLRILLSIVREYESQVFITTHSREWLEALIEAADGQVDDISLWRIKQGEHGPEIAQFDGSTLRDGIEYGAEVRGEAETDDDIPASSDM